MALRKLLIRISSSTPGLTWALDVFVKETRPGAFLNFSTSRLTMRPPGPVPVISDRLIFFSSAIRLAMGEALIKLLSSFSLADCCASAGVGPGSGSAFSSSA